MNRIVIAFAAAVLMCAQTLPVTAHNQSIHQKMTDLAWQMMLFVETNSVDPNPQDAEWAAFLQRVAGTPIKYNTRPAQIFELISTRTDACTPSVAGWNTTLAGIENAPRWDFKDLIDCGVDKNWKPSLDGVRPSQFTGATLGVWAAHPDFAYEDTHLWYRLTSAGGLGAIKNVVNEVGEDALTLALVPIVCIVDFFFGDGDCLKDAKNIADDVNVTEEIDSWIPGIGDISNDDYVGVWHFIDMNGGASNDYDPHQGKLFDEAGVPGEPMDPLEVVLMAFFDTSGLSVNFDKSDGVSNYSATTANDGLPNTIGRDKADWQYTTIAHTPFEPVNNLAWYGWIHFRDETLHPVRMLGWPLHAIGDATVPQHVMGTSAWGHRPYEDSQDLIWDSVWNFKVGQVETQRPTVERVMRRAFEYWKTIEAWRTAHGGSKDIPMRQLIIDLATHTHDYAMAQHLLTGGNWPFSAAASTTYLVAKNDTNAAYAVTDGAADKVRPLYEDGMGLIIAMLVAAADYF